MHFFLHVLYPIYIQQGKQKQKTKNRYKAHMHSLKCTDTIRKCKNYCKCLRLNTVTLSYTYIYVTIFYQNMLIHSRTCMLLFSYKISTYCDIYFWLFSVTLNRFLFFFPVTIPTFDVTGHECLNCSSF